MKIEQASQTIDEYIRMYPKDVQVILEKIRRIIRSIAPKAEETIKYGIPTFVLNKKNLVHVGAYASHIGFYPTSSGITHFKKELKGYTTSKGTVQFPLTKPIPYPLIEKITTFRVVEVG